MKNLSKFEITILFLAIFFLGYSAARSVYDPTYDPKGGCYMEGC